MISDTQEKRRTQDELPEGIEAEEGPQEIFDPFNPADVDIITKTEVVIQILNRIERRYTDSTSAHINLAPEFQRKDNIWTPQKQSQLIESILLGIPLPMFYVSATRSGEWDVVDGVQRLSTLRNFVLGEKFLNSVENGKKNESLRGRGFPLKGLEFLQQFEGKKFNDLPSKQQDDLRGCNIQVTVIRAGTPDQVKFNIFKRLNTGGLPLTTQEVRHALYQGAATEFLKELVLLPIFKEATAGSIKDTRMEGRELILRMLASLLLRDKSNTAKIDIESILNSTMHVLNHIGGTLEKSKKSIPEYNKYTLHELKNIFIIGMTRAKELFDKYAFRKSFPGERRTQINKALFETWSVYLGTIDENIWMHLLKNKKTFISNYEHTFTIKEFIDSIGMYSYLSKYIDLRYTIIQKIIKISSKGEQYALTDNNK